MRISVANKPQLTGIIILFVGVVLLLFTFINAFLFLREPLSILATGELTKVFGDALAPLIQASVRLMYLGIMGWIGSLLTIRGIPLVTHKLVPSTEPIPIIQDRSQLSPQLESAKQLASAPAPQSQPQQIPQQSKPTTASQQPRQIPQSSPPQARTSQPLPETRPKQAPEAILIPPENQKEE